MTELFTEGRCGGCYGTGAKGAAERCPVCGGSGTARYLNWEKFDRWVGRVNSTLASLEERLERGERSSPSSDIEAEIDTSQQVVEDREEIGEQSP
jgi:DnaJ-class molecular chaperone